MQSILAFSDGSDINNIVFWISLDGYVVACSLLALLQDYALCIIPSTTDEARVSRIHLDKVGMVYNLRSSV